MCVERWHTAALNFSVVTLKNKAVKYPIIFLNINIKKSKQIDELTKSLLDDTERKCGFLFNGGHTR